MNNLSPNFWPNRVFGDVTGTPTFIVLHRTGGSFLSAKGWLCNPASDASATVLIGKDGTTLQLVRDEDAPWTNGFTRGQTSPPTNPLVLRTCWNLDPSARVNPNLFTLSAEIEWLDSDGVIEVGSPQYLAVVRWVADKCNRWHIPATREYIMGHNEITPKEKPLCGAHIPWPYLIADVQKLITPPPNLSAPATPSDWAKVYWEAGKLLKITDGTRPKEPATREEVVTMLIRLLGPTHKPIRDALAAVMKKPEI